jgi:hypothetical protein
MGPATRSWVCPSCGVQNGPAVPSSAPAKLQRTRSPFTRNERTPLVVVVVAAVVVIAVIWFFLGRGSDTPLPASPSSSAPLTAAQAITKLCGDIPIDLNLRVDALNRTAMLVRTDAEAIKEAGDRPTSHKAVAVAVAMENFAKTLETHGDTSADTDALNAAITGVKPSCRAG